MIYDSFLSYESHHSAFDFRYDQHVPEVDRIFLFYNQCFRLQKVNPDNFYGFSKYSFGQLSI